MNGIHTKSDKVSVDINVRYWEGVFSPLTHIPLVILRV